jgi:hypothetical protein
LLLVAVGAGTACIELPKSQTVDRKVLHLDQNWTEEQRQRFYHASQGTVLMPAEWFLALEQPEIKFIGSVGLFRDDAYLSRFGFLPDDVGPHNPAGLPVGFSDDEVVMPDSGETLRAVGLSCAACHVGQLNYRGRSIRVDGGTSMIEVTQFQNALGMAVFLTAKLPFRFARFAERVLGPDSTAEERLDLKAQLDEMLAAGLAEAKAAKDGDLYDESPGGFGRTDALARIGNYLFGTELDDVNLVEGNAPVKFPHIWDVSWFSWAQYNSSVEQPMVRNIGEALGVRARVNLDPTSPRFMESTVDVEGLIEIEGLLAGEAPFQGLQSPSWPDEVFGPLEQQRVERGRALYQDLCQGCHLPPLDSRELWEDLERARSAGSAAGDYWVSNDHPGMAAGFEPPAERAYYLDNSLVNLGEVGTDPGQALNMIKRVVRTPGIVLPSPIGGFWRDGAWQGPEWYTPIGTDGAGFPQRMMGLGAALQSVTVAIAQGYYDDAGVPEEGRRQLSGNRNPGARALMAYRTRPLNGAWAAPPYLHNGSVPSLFQLLSPAEERDDVFYTGSHDYDPVEVGFSTSYFPGAFRYDTSVIGNSNRGHEFDDGPLGDGIIGPRLTVEQRYELIEYLKSLDPAPPPEGPARP